MRSKLKGLSVISVPKCMPGYASLGSSRLSANLFSSAAEGRPIRDVVVQFQAGHGAEDITIGRATGAPHNRLAGLEAAKELHSRSFRRNDRAACHHRLPLRTAPPVCFASSTP